ncbi:hypothetical protein D3C80_1225850 [compost metagenome]
MTLRGVGVGPEKNQLCAVVTDDNRVTRQVNVDQPRKGDDVFTEHIRLRLTGRQKYLVLPGFQRAQKCLARKVKRRANLTRFEDVANTVRDACPVPVELILKRLVEENLFQLFDSLVAEKVTFRLFAIPFVATRNVGI